MLDQTIRQQVYERANGCCEYCQTCEMTMQVDHIKPSNGDDLSNLALSSWNCNNHKRQAIEAIDPETKQIEPLFHPRQNNWYDHFQWIDNQVILLGLTPTGRATIERLKMNRPAIVNARQRWVEVGYHPPKSIS